MSSFCCKFDLTLFSCPLLLHLWILIALFTELYWDWDYAIHFLGTSDAYNPGIVRFDRIVVWNRNAQKEQKPELTESNKSGRNWSSFKLQISHKGHFFLTKKKCRITKGMPPLYVWYGRINQVLNCLCLCLSVWKSSVLFLLFGLKLYRTLLLHLWIVIVTFSFSDWILYGQRARF